MGLLTDRKCTRAFSRATVVGPRWLVNSIFSRLIRLLRFLSRVEIGRFLECSQCHKGSEHALSQVQGPFHISGRKSDARSRPLLREVEVCSVLISGSKSDGSCRFTSGSKSDGALGKLMSLVVSYPEQSDGALGKLMSLVVSYPEVNPMAL